MKLYGEEVNTDRAVVDYRDGLKPVARRLIWSAYAIARVRPVKAARIVGDTMGRYHPHGDLALYGALVTQVNAEVHTFNGDGNWGTLIDPPAAMRYPEAALSEYGRSFLHPHYRPVMDMVSNYDKREKEPLCLPSLFPNVLMNSTIGIGVGTSAAIPSFTPPSLLKVMVRLLDGEKLTASDYAKSLEFFDPWGAKAVKSKANAASIKAFITSSKGSVTWTAPLKVDREKKRITMEAFAPNTRIETIPAKAPKKPKPGLIDRIRMLPERPDVFSVNGGLGYVIQAKRTLNYPEFDKMVSTVERMLTKPVKYEINVTERNPSPGPEEYKTAFFSLSVEKLIHKWLVYRIQLEKKSLVERVRVQKEHIDYTKLLIYAADKLDVIFKGLRTSDPDSFLVKHLRITPEQAKQILALRVRQLSKLDQDQLKLKLVELQKLLKDLERRTRSPKKEVRDFLDRCSSLFKLERSKMGHWHWVLTKIDNVKDTEVEAVSQEA
jgi:DNA gyrase/topoisomerase IV subunit A